MKIHRATPVMTLASVLLPLACFGAALAQVSFDPPNVSDLAGPGAGSVLETADFNGDCLPDLLATRDETVASETESMVVRYGLGFDEGEGLFPDGFTLQGGQAVTDAILVDINNDGLDDLISTESFEPQGGPWGLCASTHPRVPVFLGNLAGEFTFSTCLTAKDHPKGVVAGDFDEDGEIDLVVVNATISCCGATSPEALFFHGNADGSFAPGVLAFSQRGHELKCGGCRRGRITWTSSTPPAPARISGSVPVTVCLGRSAARSVEERRESHWGISTVMGPWMWFPWDRPRRTATRGRSGSC